MTYHSYIFFDSKDGAAQADPSDFVQATERSTNVKVAAYKTVGLKAGSRFMLWMSADEPEHIQNLTAALMHTTLGAKLTISHVLFGMVRPSQYVGRATSQEQAIQEDDRGRYLIIYPFTKTKEWYLLSKDQRREMMGGHIRVGHAFKSVRQLLVYSFGLDDNEFVVSYETESLGDFQSLVMELRSTEARLYTQNDTPVFVCVHGELGEVLKVV
jgi:chlorite dismutase